MKERRSLARWVLGILGSLIGLWLIAPALVVIPLAFSNAETFVFPPPAFSLRWFESFAADPRWISSLSTSIVVGLFTMIVACVLGTMTAFALDRSSFPGKSFFQYLVISPMIIPIILAGIAYYSFFLRLHLTDSILGFVLAHTVLALPFVVTSVTPALSRPARSPPGTRPFPQGRTTPSPDTSSLLGCSR